MKRGRRLLILLLSAFLLTAFSFAASGVNMPKIDGDPTNLEWEGSRQAMLFNSAEKSGNNMSFCVFKFIHDFANKRFAFAIRAIGVGCLPGSLAGVRLEVGTFGILEFRFDDPQNPSYDGELTHVRSAMRHWGNSGDGEDFSAEAMVDLKSPIPASLILTVQILNAIDEPSHPFSFTVENELALAPTTAPPVLTSAHPPVSTTKTPKTRPAATTKPTKAAPTVTAPSNTAAKYTAPAAPQPSGAWTVAPTPSAAPYTGAGVTHYYAPGPVMPSVQAEEQSVGEQPEEEEYAALITVENDAAEAGNSFGAFGSGGGVLRTAAFAVAFTLLLAAAAIGILRKPKADEASDESAP